MQRTDMGQWEDIAAAINDLEAARRDLLDELTKNGNVPKTAYGDQYRRIGDATTKLKSDLENRMFDEHSDDASTDVFYGSDGETVIEIPEDLAARIRADLDDGQTFDDWVEAATMERIEYETQTDD
ncbi:hypothetical protein HTZ84_22500 [Haloterrigena sp. SYSU A558-1]|uniref:Uncharacterized protein n=1 Tax=Haloterrigena gelatinilytica TaxID=2741724 RepID=A0ABX2LFK9_9EURY|nr:hypothetical protein [Haloterrigena gelatinilytica]NUC75039.1 hypothetical protein [Haloterrigena gelatinilytica]